MRRHLAMLLSGGLTSQEIFRLAKGDPIKYNDENHSYNVKLGLLMPFLVFMIA